MSADTPGSDKHTRTVSATFTLIGIKGASHDGVIERAMRRGDQKLLANLADAMQGGRQQIVSMGAWYEESRSSQNAIEERLFKREIHYTAVSTEQ